MNCYGCKKDGSITVFLSLVLLLILSLLFTVIEGARVGTVKVYAQRAINTAMDSVLAEYYGPLWEEYHLFGYDMGNDRKEEQKQIIEDKLTEYMSYTFEPNQGQDKTYYKEALELYDIKTTKVAVSEETLLMDHQGKLLVNEAVEYQKYAEIGDGLELLLDKMALLETPQKVSIIYEEKQKVEEELVEIDQGILELMELFDGISTTKKGVDISEDNQLVTKDCFIKQFCIVEPTMEAVGVNSEILFEALKGKYINPISKLDTINLNIIRINEISDEIALLEIKISEASNALAAAQKAMDGIGNSSSKEAKEKANAISQSISSITQHISMLSQQITTLEKEKENCIQKIKTSQEILRIKVWDISSKIEEAIGVIEYILFKTEKAKPFIENYEILLNEQKKDLSEEVYTELENGLNQLKKYVDTDVGNYNLSDMISILENNLVVLEEMEEYLVLGEDYFDNYEYFEAIDVYEEAMDCIQGYQIEGLTLDYSNLVLSKDKTNPLKEVNQLLQSGLLDLVIDPDLVSSLKLEDSTLPSTIAALSAEDKDFLSGFVEFFRNSAYGEKGEGLSALFAGLSDGTQMLSLAGNTLNKATEHLLYQEYIKEHFSTFPKEGEDLQTRKPSAMLYEQEYLLAGKTTDDQNLSSMVSRMLLCRFAFDFVSLLGDKTKCNEARVLAAAAVGFTGLPILVSLTQALILLIWSFVEALVDVCALMMGKAVPILKKKIVMELPELFLINREYLQSKAPLVASDKELSLSYHEYLRIFLLAKGKQEIAFRSMDLMQENINLRYKEDFRFEHCMFGFKTDMAYEISPKFTGFLFVQKVITNANRFFVFHTTSEYSY